MGLFSKIGDFFEDLEPWQIALMAGSVAAPFALPALGVGAAAAGGAAAGGAAAGGATGAALGGAAAMTPELMAATGATMGAGAPLSAGMAAGAPWATAAGGAPGAAFGAGAGQAAGMAGINAGLGSGIEPLSAMVAQSGMPGFAAAPAGLPGTVGAAAGVGGGASMPGLAPGVLSGASMPGGQAAGGLLGGMTKEQMMKLGMRGAAQALVGQQRGPSAQPMPMDAGGMRPQQGAQSQQDISMKYLALTNPKMYKEMLRRRGMA